MKIITWWAVTSKLRCKHFRATILKSKLSTSNKAALHLSYYNFCRELFEVLLAVDQKTNPLHTNSWSSDFDRALSKKSLERRPLDAKFVTSGEFRVGFAGVNCKNSIACPRSRSHWLSALATGAPVLASLFSNSYLWLQVIFAFETIMACATALQFTPLSTIHDISQNVSPPASSCALPNSNSPFPLSLSGLWDR